MGLAVGMACCILIALYVRDELSFDTFHDNTERIVAVGSSNTYFGKMLSTPYPLADAMVEEFPQVNKAVRMNGTGQLLLSRDSQNFIELDKGYYSEPEFFDMFSFELKRGAESGDLSTPNTIVLTESSSRGLFGMDNPIGESLYWQKQDTMLVLKVTGIVENPPAHSSIGFSALVSQLTMEERFRNPEGWRSYSFRTYALLNSSDAFGSLENSLQKLVESNYKPNDSGEYRQGFFTIPLTELHLSEITNDRGFTGNRAYLYLFGSVALFILVIACVNYINLATARATLRAKEVGVRKTLGARRVQVAGQFISESIILSTGAYILGGLITLMALPFFNDLFGTSIEWKSSGAFLGWLFFASAAIGIFAGLYPSIYLSRFAPVTVLRNRLGQSGSGSILRKSLVVGQFAIALVLIIGAIVVYQQLQYTQTKDLGFEGEQVVVADLPSREAWDRRNLIRDNLAGQTGIRELSLASGSPGEINVRMGHTPDKLSPEANVNDNTRNITFAPIVVDYNFLDLLDIQLIAGWNFSREKGSDANRAYIINEKAAEILGWTPEEAVGKPFNMSGEGEVIGVVEDFHISSLHKEIESVVLHLHESESWYAGGSVLARLSSGNIREGMDAIEQEIAALAPNVPFSYEFLDERFDAMYRTERRLGKIVGLFTFIAIIIACFGLYGLAAFSAERRTKEIGVRKVLGATVSNIVSLLSKDFLKLVLLGFVLAVPVAWYLMNRWLQDFAYRVEIGVGIFAVAGFAATLIAFITVSWQSVRAAVANPVESLRSE